MNFFFFSLCLIKISYCKNILPLDLILCTSGKSPALPCLVVGQQLDSPLSFSPGKHTPLYVVCSMRLTRWPYTELILGVSICLSQWGPKLDAVF